MFDLLASLRKPRSGLTSVQFSYQFHTFHKMAQMVFNLRTLKDKDKEDKVEHIDRLIDRL